MEKLYLEEIATAVNGKIIFGNGEVYSDSVVIDSRKVTPNSLFIGIAGENVDGNDYMLNAFERGASIALVEKDEDIIATGSKGLIRVESTKDALVDLAKYYKQRLRAKCIVVTGSTGKTTVKDMLHGMLSTKYKVFKTRGNYNNELGLPLMLLSMDSSFDMAVLEMGMSSIGEIHFLSEIVRQDAALITNIGVSHIELLKTRENILKAKMEVADFFNEGNTLFLNADDGYLKTVGVKDYRIIRAGIDSGEYQAVNIRLDRNGIEFDVLRLGEAMGRIKLNAPGIHNVRNAILAFACANEYGVAIDALKNLRFERTAMRLEEYKFDNITVINDAYNASPDSMKAGLDTLKVIPGRKVALVGDMKELGELSFESHKECGRYARDRVDVMIAVGGEAQSYRTGFGGADFYGFPTFEEAAKALPNILQKGDLVYVKASRSMGFERFMDILERI